MIYSTQVSVIIIRPRRNWWNSRFSNCLFSISYIEYYGVTITLRRSTRNVVHSHFTCPLIISLKYLAKWRFTKESFIEYSVSYKVKYTQIDNNYCSQIYIWRVSKHTIPFSKQCNFYSTLSMYFVSNKSRWWYKLKFRVFSN